MGSSSVRLRLDSAARYPTRADAEWCRGATSGLAGGGGKGKAKDERKGRGWMWLDVGDCAWLYLAVLGCAWLRLQRPWHGVGHPMSRRFNVVG